MALTRAEEHVPGASHDTAPSSASGAGDVPGTRVPLGPAVVDAVAILVFVTIGQVSHHGGVSVSGYAEDALPFLACWFAAAWLFHDRFVPTWLVGVSAGVLVRAAILGHWYAKELAFWVVSVVVVGALAGVGRLLARLSRRG